MTSKFRTCWFRGVVTPKCHRMSASRAKYLIGSCQNFTAATHGSLRNAERRATPVGILATQTPRITPHDATFFARHSRTLLFCFPATFVLCGPGPILIFNSYHSLCHSTDCQPVPRTYEPGAPPLHTAARNFTAFLIVFPHQVL
jgi:hypothetical protein